MRQISVLEWTRRLPFVPFVIHCSDGATYVVRNPELVVASMAHVAITLPGIDNIDVPAVTISYFHCVRIEPWKSPINDSTDGDAQAFS